ncbi:hypothetical protein P9112_011318 [Eukaryota sp. TZLM1-RC]
MISAPNKNRIVKRWLPILSKFNFDVVHIAGEENYWADMLSRLVNLNPSAPRVQQVRNLAPHVVEEQLPYLNILTKANLLRVDTTQPSTVELPTIHSLSALKEAVEDPKFDLFDSWISKIRQEQMLDVDSNPDNYKDYKYDTNNQLYTNNCGKIIIPDSLKKQTLTIIHGHANVGHPSVTTSVKKLLESDYFWPNMRKYMIMHIKSCPACQKTAPVSRKVIESSGSLWADRPFTRINADTIGPLQEDDNGFKYLIVFVDSFTRYTIICPIKELNAVEATNQLLWNVVAIFGIPLLIHSDNGIEFANAIFKGLCDLLYIEVSRSLTSFSQSNGLVERRHRDILLSLRKILVDSGDYSNWSEYIPIVQLQINSTASRVTGHSPYNLMFGSDHSPRSDPSNLFELIKLANFVIPFVKDLEAKLDRISRKREEAELRQAQQLPENNLQRNPFNIGDLVLRLKTNGKLHGCFAGPFLIEEVKSNKSLLLKNLVTGSLSTASINHCKLNLSDFSKEDLDWDKNIAAGDMEESVIVKIIDHFDYVDSNNNKVPYCTAVCNGNETSYVPVADVKSTEAYQTYLRSISPRTNRKRKASSNSKSKTNSPAISTRSSRSRSKKGKR